MDGRKEKVWGVFVFPLWLADGWVVEPLGTGRILDAWKGKMSNVICAPGVGARCCGLFLWGAAGPNNCVCTLRIGSGRCWGGRRRSKNREN